jgi:phospho-N-acetylmuramoyl-pentapeptide-transferase
MLAVLHIGFLFLSLAFSLVLIVPFINLLYKLNFKRAKQKTIDAFGRPTPIFDHFNSHKAGTPVGGGILVIIVVSLLFLISLPLLDFFEIPINYNYAQNPQAEVFVLLFTFLGFGILGLYDDIKKFFNFKKSSFFGLRLPQKLLIQAILASIIAFVLYYILNINFINIPFFGELTLGWFYLPFAVFTIVAFANAVNVTDGLDGLASGTLLLCLFGLWLISFTILDLPLAIFVALFIGSLLSFLYFNVYPARIFLGDVGSLSFGATLAVIGLLIGKPIALIVIGFIFVLEIGSSLFQLLSKKFFHKKLFPASPVHLWLQKRGWEEPKIVQRFWIIQIILTLIGLWITLL